MKIRFSLLVVVFSLFFSSLYAAGSKPAVAIVKFKIINISPSLAELVSENLLTYIVDTQKYEVVEREQLDTVLRETRLSSSDLANRNNAVRVGRLISAQGIIVGSIIKFGTAITINARLVSTETGRVIRSASRQITENENVAAACKFIAYKLVNIPLQNEAPVSGNYGNLVGAVISGNMERVKSLINEGINVNTQNETGVSPLMYAAYYNRSNVIKILTSGGAKLEMKDKYGQTALLHAAHRGRLQAVSALLKAGANVNAAAENNHHQTALMYAVFFGYTDIVKILIKNGANVNMRNAQGNTALGYALSKNFNEIAAIIRNAGGRE